MQLRHHILTVLLAAVTASATVAGVPATTPADRLNLDWWKQRHEAKLNAPDRQGAQLVFIGDSITQGWEGAGKGAWQKFYGHRHAFNLGYGGDRTQHVLWRLDHGEVDGMHPKLIVMMIGTNNTGGGKDKPEDIAAGVRAIGDKLGQKLPNTKILLLAIFPRSANPADAPRVNNEAANKLIAKLGDNRRIFYLDINQKFLQPDGTLTKQIMPDLLHPKEHGYQIWAGAIEPMVAKLLGETKSK